MTTYNPFNQGALLMDGFPEELFEVVNDHWSQFPAVNPMINQLFGICFLALTFVTMSACLLIIYVFATTEELRIPVPHFRNRVAEIL